jgi:hypothetical protein
MVLAENMIDQRRIGHDSSATLQSVTGFDEGLDKPWRILGSFVGGRAEVGLGPGFAGTRVVRLA